MADADRLWFSAALSDTPLADEYRRLESALRQCAPLDQAFDPAPHPPEVVDKARTWWRATMRTEYDAASTFVELSGQLRAINAPLDVQMVALRMAQDELRHAALCARVIEAMGGTANIQAPAPRRPAAHPDCGPEEGVLRSVIFGCCLAEMVNAARLAKLLGDVADPFVRDAFRQLLSDERLHAQFGFYYLDSRRDWLAAHPDTRRSLARYLRYAFAALEQTMGAVPADARPLTDAERAIGLPDITDLSASFQETMLNASVPGLERFGIEAGAAWTGRTTRAAT